MNGPVQDPYDDDLVGTVLDGRFELTELIGEGGCADVYRGHQRSVDLPVAVKVLHTRATTETTGAYQRRFIREGQVVGRIRHPGVVRVYDFGFHNQHPYIVMELLEGHTIHEELDASGALAMGRSVRLMTEALEGLAAAHRLDIVHRDLKPSNLFLSLPGTGEERVSILDFGLALAEDDERVTKMGQVNGTPQYLAPEYIRNNVVSRSMDIYQMGLILVEMLTGRAAVDCTTTFECMLRHTKGQLDIPGWVEASKLAPIIHRATALAPSDRYGEVEEFIEALRALNLSEGEHSGFAWQRSADQGAPPTSPNPVGDLDQTAESVEPATDMIDAVALAARRDEVLAAEARTDLSAETPLHLFDDFEEDDPGEFIGEPTQIDSVQQAPIIINEGRAASSVRRPGEEPEQRSLVPTAVPGPISIASQGPSLESHDARSSGGERRLLLIGIAVATLALVVLVGVLMVFAVMGMAEPSSRVPASTDAVATIPGSPSDLAADPGVASLDDGASSRVVVTVAPASAKIRKGRRVLGIGQVTLTFSEGDRRSRNLTFEAAGYRRAKRSVGPDDDAVKVVLDRIR